MSDTTVERSVAPKQLLALVKEVSLKREKTASITQEIAERVAAAVESGHLHKGAFALMVRLNRMDEGKRDDFVRALPLYIDIMEEVWVHGGHTGDLVDDAEKADSEEQSAVDDQMAENAKRAAGIKQLAPDAPDGKPKRGRPRKGSLAILPIATEDLPRGARDFAAGIAARIPDDLEGKPDEAEQWLADWDEASVALARQQDAAKATDRFEDDSSSAKPSRRQNEKRESLPGGDAPGTYSITH